MTETRFQEWKPTLRGDIHLREDATGEVILLGPRGDFLAALPPRWRQLLGRMDGRADVATLLTEDARHTGRYDPRGLTTLLLRLRGLGAFSGPVPAIPTPEATPTVLDRLLATLGRGLDLNLTGSAPAPWDPGRWTIPVFGFLVLAAHVLILFLFLDGLIASGEAGLARPLAYAGAAIGGLSLSMTLRGLVRWYVLFIARRPARRVGLRVRFGLPFLDVDPRAASALSSRQQVLVAGAGVLALAVAAAAMLFLPAGGPLARVAGRAALLALAFDLCPFARSDGSLLLESLLGIRWLRGRTLRYLRQGLVAQVRRRRAGAGEEWRLLLVLGAWALWAGLALPFLAFPALTAALDITGALLTAALATDDAVASVLGLAIGLYLALLFCVVSVFTVLLVASFVLRSLAALAPLRLGVDATPEVKALPEALAAAGLPGEAADGAAEGRWLRLRAGDVFPRPDAPFAGVALLVAGRAGVERSEVSGMVHPVANADIGWLVEGNGETPGWRWTLRPRGLALLLLFDGPVEGPLGRRAHRIRRYEDCPALWGLGPDGVRWAASFDVEERRGDLTSLDRPDAVLVLLEGALRHVTPDGDVRLDGPRVLPRPGPRGSLQTEGPGARVLCLPAPGPGTFLPAWWSSP
jgi:hypothetical protein